MSEYHSSVTFIVVADDLDPREVTLALGLTPDRAWARGDKKGRSQNEEHLHEWGGWKLFQSPANESLPLEVQIESWIRILSEKREALQLLKAGRHHLLLSCFISTEATASPVLRNEFLVDLGALGIALEFNFFVEQ